MTTIPLLLQAEAAAHQKAVRSTAYRHRHLSPKPFVVCAYNLSGEAAAPLAIVYGTSPKHFKIAVSAEPRNRESRFRAINVFAADLHAYVSPFLKTVTCQGGGPGSGHFEFQAAIDAPQIVVPNRATRDYLGDRLGRSLRYLGLGDTHEVPEETLWAGAHLSWFADHAHYPGQSIFLAATELLGRHFHTGQSSFEDENLASLLAWIDNPADSGLDAILAAESTAPFGPVPDPRWESTLEPLVRAYITALRADDFTKRAKVEKQVGKLVRLPLADAYAATHRALDVMRGIPESASSPRRWETDVREWSGYCRRIPRGIPRFRKRHDALQAARRLEAWSKALEHLEADEAFDDPMVMAEFDADGQCLSGTVRAVDLANREVKPGKVRRTKVPLVTLRLASPTRLLPDASVVWASDRKVTGAIRAVPAVGATGDAVIAIMGGHGNGASVPAVSDSALFVTLTPFQGKSPGEPIEVPWTHRPGEGETDPLLITDMAFLDATDASAGADDGSSDLNGDELAALPELGSLGPEDVPAVNL